MHNITANSEHIVIPVMLAMHRTIQDVDTATDGLNESLREWVVNNFLADYEIDLKAVQYVMSDSEPEEGDLFATPSAINTIIYPDFVKDVTTKTVWVVGSQSFTSSSFDWYHNEQDAINAFERDKKSVPIGKTQCCMFAFEVDENASAEEVTQEVSDFYYEMALSKEFNASELVQCYPFTPDAWLDIVDNHNKQL